MLNYSICLFCCNKLVLLECSRCCRVVWPKKCAGEEKDVDRGSSWTIAMRLPNSLTRFNPSLPQTPVVAFDSDGYKIDMVWQISIFGSLFGFCLGCFCTSYNASRLVSGMEQMYLGMWRPMPGSSLFCHGTVVMPSGRFPFRTEAQWFSSYED